MLQRLFLAFCLLSVAAEDARNTVTRLPQLEHVPPPSAGFVLTPAFLHRSVANIGDAVLLQRFLGKLQAKECARIVTVGGSITVGGGKLESNTPWFVRCQTVVYTSRLTRRAALVPRRKLGLCAPWAAQWRFPVWQCRTPSGERGQRRDDV